MKINPISFNSMLYKGNINKVSNVSNRSFLGNIPDSFSKGTSGFEAQSPQNNRGCFDYEARISALKTNLGQHKRIAPDRMSDLLKYLSRDEAIFNIQESLLLKLSKDENINSNALESVLFYISPQKEIAEIQREVLEHVFDSDNDKYDILSFCEIAEKMKTSKGPALKIQKEALFALLENKNLDGSDINNIVFSFSKTAEIAKIQSELAFELLKNNKYSPENIGKIISSLSSDKKEAQSQRALILNLSRNEKFSGEDIKNIIRSLDRINKKSDFDFASYATSRKVSGFESQKKLVLQLAENDRFSGSDIAKICSRFHTHLRGIEKDCKLISFLSKYESFDPCDIADSLFGYMGTKEQNDFTKNLKKSGLINHKSIAKSYRNMIGDARNNSESVMSFISDMQKRGFFEKNSLFERKSLPIYEVKNFMSKQGELNKKRFLDYLGKIDFEKLEDTAPLVNKFSVKNYMIFTLYHFMKDGKTEFSKEDLNFGDLGELASDKYLNGRALMNLVSAFPETKTEVGEIPKDWLDKVDNKEKAQEEIYSAIDNFMKEKSLTSFSCQLSDILKKDVEVTSIGSGAFGEGYRISIPNTRDVCLKTFKDEGLGYGNINCNTHGEHSEVQMGLFVNRHSKDFVKMYFGRVAPYGIDQKGFLVTQYLDDLVDIDSSVGKDFGRYRIVSSDAKNGHNVIRGVVYDFGGLEILDGVYNTGIQSFDIFRKY